MVSGQQYGGHARLSDLCDHLPGFFPQRIGQGKKPAARPSIPIQMIVHPLVAVLFRLELIRAAHVNPFLSKQFQITRGHFFPFDFGFYAFSGSIRNSRASGRAPPFCGNS